LAKRLKRLLQSKIFLGFFFYLLAIIFAKDGFYSSDVMELYAQSAVLHEHHTVHLDSYKHFLPEERTKYGVNGHMFSKYSIGYPLLSAAYMGALKLIKANRLLTHKHNFFIPNVFFFILSAYLFFLMVKKLNPEDREMSFIVGVAYLLSTSLTFYSVGWPANSFEAILLVFALYAFHRFMIDPSRRGKFLIFCGMAVGYAGLSRLFPFLAIPGFLLALMVLYYEDGLKGKLYLQTITKKSIYFLIPCIAAVLLNYLVNYVKSGYWHTTYGLDENFRVPFYVGFLGVMFWPAKSFIIFAPITLLSIFGFYSLYKRSKTLFVLCTYISLLYIIMMSKWWAWMSGPEIGPRFWLPAIPFLILPIVFLRRKSFKIIAVFLVGFGVFVQGLQYQGDPASTWWRLIQEFPGYESTQDVQKVIHTDFTRVLKTTFIDLNYFRHYIPNNHSLLPPLR